MRDFASSIGIELSESHVNHLINGKRIRYGDRIYYATHGGELRSAEPENSDVQIRNMWKVMKKRNKVDVGYIIDDPVGHYSDMLRKLDPRGWAVFFGGDKNRG